MSGTVPAVVEPVPPRDIISNQQARELAGGVTRKTLLDWRRTRGFPDPIRVVPGPGSSDVELWDARQVRAWLKAHRKRKRPTAR